MPDADLEHLARDAYIWGYPLVVMHRTRALHCSRTPIGQLNHVDRLATPADRTVVAPNNDTLYSSGWYDLTAGDLVVDVPPIDRYWSVMVLDAYTNVQYISRRTHGTAGARVRLVLDADRMPAVDAVDELPVATPTAWVLVRTLVDGPDDLGAARAAQHGITITTPPGHPDHTTERLGRPNRVHDAGVAFFDELANALEVDPAAAWQPPPPSDLDVLIGRRDAASDGVVAAGIDEGERSIAATRQLSDMARNGWGTSRTGSDFGNDVTRRAAVAKFALAAHHPAENRSYIAQHDANGDRLDGDRALSLRFAPGEPPCRGFWSLTVYGPDVFLVDNEIDRYAIGDRTPGLRFDDDGGLSLTIGGSRPEAAPNWLPAPPGRYVLALRVYEGDDAVVHADWFPPLLDPMGSH
jgi:hypothetical protein